MDPGCVINEVSMAIASPPRPLLFKSAKTTSEPQPVTANAHHEKSGKSPCDKADKTLKAKTPLDESLQQCSKLRVKYLQTCSKARSLMDQIAVEEGWGWAQGDQRLGRLSTTLARLTDYMKNNGLGQLLNEAPASLKKQVGAEHFLQLLRLFLASSELIDNVDADHSEMVRTHRARAAK